MAGDWIPVEYATPRKSEILRIAHRTGRSRHEVLGLMVEFWCWAAEQTVDGRVGAPVSTLCLTIGADEEFWRAVVEARWIDQPDGKDSDWFLIPRADHWMTEGAKSRLTKSRRQKQWRNGKASVDASVGAVVGAHVDKSAPTLPSTTEENRRESTESTGSVAKSTQGSTTGAAELKKISSQILEPIVGQIFARAKYRGEDGAIFWKAAALLELGAISEDELWDACEAAKTCGKNKPAYFHSSISRAVRQRKGDFKALVDSVWITPNCPSQAPRKDSL